MSEADDALIVLTTVEQPQDAERLARLLVERELAACVQTLPPMVSIYRWQGKIEHANEVLLLIKTTREAYLNRSNQRLKRITLTKIQKLLPSQFRPDPANI